MNSQAIQRCIEPDCLATYPLNARLYSCAKCGSLLDVETPLPKESANLKKLWRERKTSLEVVDRSGVWRFRELLPLQGAEVVSLCEGNTPLWEAAKCASYCGLDSLRLKHQGMNPTGSFKDTGMTAAVTQARVLNARLLVCASTGNTAASLAAYAARANIPCAILVPAGRVSHSKLAQALDYGAVLLEIEGNFDDAMALITRLAEDESIYLVNSINPFRIEGQKTVAFELAEQLEWKSPDHLVVPGGNLGNSSALGKGFHELQTLGLIDRIPQITVVQAEGAAPFAHLFMQHKKDVAAGLPAMLKPVEAPWTLASAISIGAPVSWKKAWRSLSWSNGGVITVSEQEIADAKAIIGRDGIGCEPASATTVAGIKQLVQNRVIRKDQSVVAILTGHMLKDTEYIIKYHQQQLSVVNQNDLSQRIAGNFSNAPIRVKPDFVQLSDVFARLANSERAQQ